MRRTCSIACMILATLVGCGEVRPQPDVGPNADTAWAGDTISDTSSVPVIPVVVDGWGEILDHNCQPLDRECYAKSACEAVSGEGCLFHDLGCKTGSGSDSGGYHPASMQPETLSFSSRTPGFTSTGYLGNICSCDLSLLESLDVDAISPALSCAHSYWFAKAPPP